MFENYYIGRAYRKSKSPLHIKAWTKTVNINSDKIVQLADTDTIENLTSALSQRLIADQLRLTTAESCTGGKLLAPCVQLKIHPNFTVQALLLSPIRQR